MADKAKYSIPSSVSHKGEVYIRKNFLGKGGFARCYELVHGSSGDVFAGKIVPKHMLVKEHQKQKMEQEIEIHKQLNHAYVVRFIDSFDDSQNVYIILELCRRRSLMELHKRRRTITEPECRYFMKQIVEGVAYLHDKLIIHRDLKLGNIFLNDLLEVKIGDFGLAAILSHEGERKRTLCGTPNYIAPEVLLKRGHSFEVDSWSIGCVMYTLLLGRPPFETNSLKETYTKIKTADFHIPAHRVSKFAAALICLMLMFKPEDRVPVKKMLEHDFFQGYTPSHLPISSLTMAPRFDMNQSFAPTANREPLAARQLAEDDIRSNAPKSANHGLSEDNELTELYRFVNSAAKAQIVGVGPLLKHLNTEDDAEEPSLAPIYWISKWVDYSDKYGLGYQLNDDSCGVLFNDLSRLLLMNNGDNMHYIQRDGTEAYHTLCSFPDDLNKKVTLLKYFKNYMSEHLLNAGANIALRETDEIARLPYLRTWFRTRSAMVLHLSNGTLQVNFFADHVKMMFCPLMGAVTVIDANREYKVYSLKKLSESALSPHLSRNLNYALSIIQRLQTMRSKSSVRSEK